jgi:hypothetical protein
VALADCIHEHLDTLADYAGITPEEVQDAPRDTAGRSDQAEAGKGEKGKSPGIVLTKERRIIGTGRKEALGFMGLKAALSHKAEGSDILCGGFIHRSTVGLSNHTKCLE